MNTQMTLSKEIDARNAEFYGPIKKIIIENIDKISDRDLERLVSEHYQFSFANKDILSTARDNVKKFGDQEVFLEFQRNIDEEDGHAPMYKKGMAIVGIDVDDRQPFTPTEMFLSGLRALCRDTPSFALGALYATETAAIFEHETFFDVCAEICKRRDFKYEGSLIKRFHDIHLEDGVEQGHKDGLMRFVDKTGDPEIVRAEVRSGAFKAIELMEIWWRKMCSNILGVSLHVS